MTNLRAKKKKAKEKKIQEVSLKLMEKYGIDNLSMRQIAQEAEIAVGTLYNYYSSKKELLMAIVTENHYSVKDLSFSFLKKYKDLPKEKLNIQQILSELIIYYIDELFIMNKDILKKMFEYFFSSEEMIRHGMELDEKVMAELFKVFDFLQKKGCIKDNVNINNAVFGLYSLVFTQILGYVFYFDNMEKKDLINNTKDMLNMFINGIKK